MVVLVSTTNKHRQYAQRRATYRACTLPMARPTALAKNILMMNFISTIFQYGRDGKGKESVPPHYARHLPTRVFRAMEYRWKLQSSSHFECIFLSYWHCVNL